MKTLRLNQLIALEKGAKSRNDAAISTLFHAVQKPENFSGFSKTYAPRAEDGDVFPSESKIVQLGAEQVLQDVAKSWSDSLDITLAKDRGNMSAKADVVVDGTVLLASVPVTTLLYLEKKIVDMNTFVSAIPVLDPAEEWEMDPNTGRYRTKDVVRTTKTKKIMVAFVKSPATDKHPAQVDSIQEDVPIGTWSAIKFSGALPAPRKKALLEGLDQLLRAVRMARESANMAEAELANDSQAVFAWLYR